MNSSHHFAAPHKNYIRGIDEKICRYMYELTDQDELCEFIKISPSCHDADYKVDYLHYLFCDLRITRMNGALVLLCFLAVSALVLAALTLITAPNIVTIVKFLRMSQHNAGTTVLVVINGLPDVISAFFFYKSDTEIVVNEMLGTGLYLWAFHGGIIIYNYPHILDGIYIVRDIFAFFCGLMVQFNINSEDDTSVFEGICALLFYPAYCCLVYVQHLGSLEERKKEISQNMTPAMKLRLELTKEIDILPYRITSETDPLAMSMWHQFLVVFNPLRKEIYNNSAKWQKVLMILGIFVTIPTKLIVPIIDLMMPGDGWSRLLLFINFVLSPFLLMPYIGLQYFLTYAMIGLAMGFLFLYFSTTNTPRHRFTIALYGAMCVTMITHVLESEILSMICALGNIISLKPPIIGFTLKAWGNTVPETVLWCTMVRWNIKTMPLLDFLMSPLYNMVFSLALTTVLKSIDHDDINVPIRPGYIGVSGIWFSIIHHVLFSFAILTTNFRLRKSIGFFSVSMYAVFITYFFLYQFDVIHPYGTDHVDEEKFQAATWA